MLRCLYRKDELWSVSTVDADTVGSESLRDFDAKFLHTLCASARDHLFTRVDLVLCSTAAVLTPELFFPLLSLLLKTGNDVDWSSGVSRTGFGFGRCLLAGGWRAGGAFVDVG